MLKFTAKRILRYMVTLAAVAVLVSVLLYLAADDCPSHILLEKPVIYLYPQEEVQVSVTLEGVDMGTTYPAYDGGWTVLARPDGTLTDLSDGREYSYLFWEGAPAWISTSPRGPASGGRTRRRSCRTRWPRWA